jgi:hypothetical protein
MAERCKAGTVYDRFNIGIACSNPARGMDVCLRLSVLCCSVYVEALRRADPPSKESYQMSNGSKKLKQEPQMARHCQNPMLREERKRNK